MNAAPSKENGATLLVSLIMLILLTLFALTSFKLSTGNLKVVGNMQQRNQAESAAQGVIEQVISSSTFTLSPTATTTSSIDINGDGVPDVTVAVTPTCVSAQVIPVASLDFTKQADQNCLLGASQDFGQVGGASNDSMCANTLWDIQAVATDITSNAQYKINQGAAVRVDKNTLCP